MVKIGTQNQSFENTMTGNKTFHEAFSLPSVASQTENEKKKKSAGKSRV
jgi:hypothetical protein